MLAMLIVAQAVLYVEDSESTETIAEAVVVRAETVSQARRVASDAALRSTFALCSDADIRALKEVAFDSSYMSDVGRIQDDHLLCSALWGRIVPFKLPAPHYSSGDTKLWNTSDLVGSPYGGTNPIAQAGHSRCHRPRPSMAWTRREPAHSLSKRVIAPMCSGVWSLQRTPVKPHHPAYG